MASVPGRAEGSRDWQASDLERELGAMGLDLSDPEKVFQELYQSAREDPSATRLLYEAALLIPIIGRVANAHGLARVYDHKKGTGTPSCAKD